MRVLLDHNLPHNLRASLGALGKHEIVTASYIGWGELKKRRIAAHCGRPGFDVFVTGDRSLIYEQDLAGMRMAIVALSANNRPIIKNHVPQFLAAIDSAVPGSFRAVQCGTFSRKKINGK